MLRQQEMFISCELCMPDIDISVLLRRSNGWDKSLNGQIKLRNCSLLQITVAVQAICKCWQADWCIVKLRESQVGDTVKVNKERDLSRCGLLTQIQHSTHPSTLSSSPFFYPPQMISHRFKFICNIQLIFHTDKDSDRYCKVLSNDSNNKKRIRG